MADNVASFRTDNKDKDSPDVFLGKMEKTMSKKRKNNYKNIEELENIYESSQYNDKKYNHDTTGIMESFDELKESMKTNLKQYVSDNEKDRKQNETDGFSNIRLSDYIKLYKPEYEPNRKKKQDQKDQEDQDQEDQDQDPKKFNAKELKKTLKLNGINWKNIKVSLNDKKKERCAKFGKDCGSGPDVKDYMNAVLMYIKQILSIYGELLTELSSLIYKSTDGKIDGIPRKSDNDISTITNVMHYIIMVPFAIYFSYNWFYPLFYRDELDNRVNYDFSEKIMGMLKGLLIRFFRCLVQPVILFDGLFRTIMPNVYFMITNTLKLSSFGPIKIIGKILTNPIFIFIGLTMIILHMTCAYSEKMMETLFACLDGKNIPFQTYLYMIVIFDLIVGIGETNIVEKYAKLLEAVMNPFVSAFWFLVLLIFSMLFIRFAGLFVVLYMYVVSYAGLAIFSSGNMSTAYKDIQEAFKSSIEGSDNSCPKTKWEKFIIKLLKIFYDYLYAIMYIIVLLYSVFTILTTMKSLSTKIILGTFFSLVITCIVVFILYFVLQNDAVTKNDIDV